ncbi:amidohydrolase family protein [Lichenifustis flavocetrariae]|uniref:Amidohydrolase family protein n=1 Tax=Lichenifustis flavocetrariae TaxID=2949735 RepID=A0AA42CKU5_9HYPH|nr:amidohydrolase family protein [Lichenifustis flavocetrariae]MCW6510939.1 amidohydrolase family protein [Lichenifustis flavocetrariae]
MPEPYAGPIVDAHHHLWDLDMQRHPWLRPQAGERGGLGDLEPLRRNYLPADYSRDAARHNIVATVHVEAGWRADDSLSETTWLDTLDKQDGVALRYVARVSLAEPDAPASIAAQAANPRVVGIRDILSWDPDPARRFAARGDLMEDPVWRANLAQLRGAGLGFDLMVFAPQLLAAARLAADFPDQPFVLNHCGSPIDRSPEGLRAWRTGLAAVAANPNVRIKISDLVAYDPNWTLSSLAMVVDACLESFGPSRAMFASDFPVAGLRATFDEVWDSFKAITASLSAHEQHALFFGTAVETYGLHRLAPGGFAS